MANNLISTPKQGVGFALVVDFQEFPGKISNPGTLSVPRSKIDANHTGLTNFKLQLPDELADPLEMTLDMQFDPTLEEMVSLMTDGAGKITKNIFLVWPKIPDAAGAAKTENMSIQLPAGYLTGDGLNVDISSILGQSVGVTGGQVEPIFRRQQAAVAPADVTFTQTHATSAAVDGALLGTLSTTYADGPAIITIGGTDADKVKIKNGALYAVGAQSADLTIDITISNFVGYRDDDTNFQFTQGSVVIDLTA